MNKEINHKLMQVNSVFTPHTPVEIGNLFAGRQKQLKQVQESFFSKGSHIIVYGDRGGGKSSLANIVKFVYSSESIFCYRTYLVSLLKRLTGKNYRHFGKFSLIHTEQRFWQRYQMDSIETEKPLLTR